MSRGWKSMEKLLLQGANKSWKRHTTREFIKLPLGIMRIPAMDEMVPKVPPNPKYSIIPLNLIPVSHVKFQGSAPSQSPALLMVSPLVPLEQFSTGNWGWNHPKSSLEVMDRSSLPPLEKGPGSPWMFSLRDGLCLTPARKIP